MEQYIIKWAFIKDFKTIFPQYIGDEFNIIFSKNSDVYNDLLKYNVLYKWATVVNGLWVTDYFDDKVAITLKGKNLVIDDILISVEEIKRYKTFLSEIDWITNERKNNIEWLRIGKRLINKNDLKTIITEWA